MEEDKKVVMEKGTALKLITLMETMNTNFSENTKEINKMAINLGSNNAILEAHHRRSTNLEQVVDSIKKAFEAMTLRLQKIDISIKTVDADLDPIKKHVGKMDKYLTMFSAVPLMFKLTFWIFVFVTSGFGCYKVIVKLLN